MAALSFFYHGRVYADVKFVAVIRVHACATHDAEARVQTRIGLVVFVRPPDVLIFGFGIPTEVTRGPH